MLGIVTLFILKTRYTPNSLEVSEILKKMDWAIKSTFACLKYTRLTLNQGSSELFCITNQNVHNKEI